RGAVARHAIGQMNKRREPFELEVIAFLDHRALLVERIPGTRVALGGLYHLGREPPRPQSLAWLATQRIAGQRFHRKLDDTPLGRFAIQQPAAEIILVPSRHDHDLARAGFQTREEIMDVPLPGGLAGALAVSILATTHRIIDNAEISAAPGDRSANTRRVIL